MPEPGTPVIWLRYLTSRTGVLDLMSFADGVGVTTISGGVDSVAVTWCVSLRFVSRSVLRVVARCMSHLRGVAVVMEGIARAEAQMAQSWTIARAMRMYMVFVVVAEMRVGSC
jgi:hypothetical protein